MVSSRVIDVCVCERDASVYWMCVCQLMGYSRLMDVCVCEWDAAVYWLYVCHLLGYSWLVDVFLSVNCI